MSNVDINVDRRTDGRTDGQKIGRLYRTLLQAGAIKISNVRTFCFLKSTFIFGKSECASGVSVPCLVKANTERRRISMVHRFYLYSQKSIPSCPVPKETVADTKVLVFSLTPTLTLQLSTGNSDHFCFFVFWKKKKMHPKKIIKQ